MAKFSKHQKREYIALSCKSIILQEGIKELTISALAKEANIGKGTIYEYFENKEDIVLELANILHKKYLLEVKNLASKANSFEEKIKILALSSYEEKYNEYRKIFKELIGVSYYSSNCAFMFFQDKWYKQNYEFLEEIIKEAIENKKIKEDSIKFIDSILSSLIGYFCLSFSKSNIQITITSIEQYLENFLELIEIKNNK
ncbi:TetR/AcrR family transcriptional regulator [Arcobacter sp. YIC-464]|uniref:TetR/AcrR family transcriptional regulator n=1 Tax=Arcobacter sp. YIC-464 TaxID=3376631 RepID=UPI003C15FB0D